MAISNIFDKAKKQADGGCLDSGYVIDGTLFDCYYTNKEWDDFVSEMERDHHELWLKFSEGDGGELNEYKDDYGNPRPPKMASYASSSRFMYEMAVTIDGFTVEEKLSTGLGGRKASLDGYLASKNLYVEAKCHEFYSHSNPKLRKGHKNLFDGIIDLLPQFSYEPKEIGKRVCLSFDGDIYNFDLKQMLCHLCGIANRVLRNRNGLQKVNFIYLIYKPTRELLDNISSEEDKDKILELFCKEKETAERIPFNDIFCAILKYFNKKKTRYTDKEIELISDKDHFKFIVCDQTNFKDVVKHL